MFIKPTIAYVLVRGFLLLFMLNQLSNAQLVDGYPDELAKKLSDQKEAELSAISKLPNQEQADYLFSKRRWDPGSKILVAFNGGDVKLHRAIEQQAKLWEKYANIEFDFGYDRAKNAYRMWSKSDFYRVAHIRIGFSEPGYWSLMGTDSMSYPANSASMNFHDFADNNLELLPSRWKTVILHEFGHALGLHHEHQHPICNQDIRWESGPSGEPNVYEIFQTWQRWSRPKVNINLQPQYNADFISSIPDKKSIMMYAMPSQVFKNGEHSLCFIKVENKNLSDLDRLGAKIAYPKNPTEALETTLAYKKVALAIAAAPLDKLNEAEQSVVKVRLNSATQAKTPLLYVQIHHESDREEAVKLQNLARQKGFFAPGIENVSRKNLKSGPQVEVRYFREIDIGSAQQIASMLKKELGINDVKILHVRSLAASVSRNLVEVWYP